MLMAKTIFSHSESQECGEWTPIQSGLDGWGHISPNTSQLKSPCETYTVSKLENGIQRTCQLQKGHESTLHMPTSKLHH